MVLFYFLLGISKKIILYTKLAILNLSRLLVGKDENGKIQGSIISLFCSFFFFFFLLIQNFGYDGSRIHRVPLELINNEKRSSIAFIFLIKINN